MKPLPRVAAFASMALGCLLSWNPLFALECPPSFVGGGFFRLREGDEPTSMAAADFDADGDLDVATVGSATGTLIILSVVRGIFRERRDLRPVAAGRGLCAADLDGDGDADLAAVSFTGSVRALLNRGDGTFFAGRVAKLFGEDDIPRRIAPCDVDGDGDADLAVVLWSRDEIAILENRGAGRFELRARVKLRGRARDIAAADLDGDGAVDLVAANSSVCLSILFNDGGGNFSERKDLWAYPWLESVAIGDFDGDGRPDIATGHDDREKGIAFFLNAGRRSFAGPQHVSMPEWYQEATRLASGDVDGDGSVDLVGLSGLSYRTVVFVVPNEGEPAFREARALPSGGDEPSAFVLADFDGDGAPDIVMRNRKSDDFTFLRNDGRGRFSSLGLLETGGSVTCLATADFDGDGNLDIAANSYPRQAFIFLGKGDRTFVLTHRFPFPGGPRSMTAADLDGDGLLDLAAILTGSSTIALARNPGFGRLTAYRTLELPEKPTDLLAEDFDGDGLVDLAVASEEADSITTLHNDGDWVFSAAARLRPFSHPEGLAAADFDGDGSVDLAVCVSLDRYVSVFLNDGWGGFARPAHYVVGTWPDRLIAGDFDGDGFPDLASNGSFERPLEAISVLLNRGDGTFRPVLSSPLAAQTRDPAALDLDGDGRLDLASICTTYKEGEPRWIGLLLNAGDGTFEEAARILFVRSPRGLITGDFDGDGAADFAVARTERPLVSVFFRDAPDRDGLPDACGSAFLRADANGDGAWNIADAVRTLRYLFLAQGFACPSAADGNDDGAVDLSDAVFLLTYLFAKGPSPPPPFPHCGFDPTPDDLLCGGHAACR